MKIIINNIMGHTSENLCKHDREQIKKDIAWKAELRRQQKKYPEHWKDIECTSTRIWGI